ncbi:MAG: HlyD family secretion protein [Candidatus Omnitrophica bacterium]|nr:HlyD family secretion protein [Candidatus Omnitrophota bacterium]
MHQKVISKIQGLNPRSQLLAGIAVLAVVAACAWGFINAAGHESTDDAFVDGHMVPVSPKVSGHIEHVYISDNEMVTRGQLLFEIDQRDYAARADLASAELQAAIAEFNQAGQDETRYHDLLAKKDISRQQYDRSELRLQTAKAQLSSAKAHLELARLNLSYTKVRAPHDGQVTKRIVEPGLFVQEGQTLLAIVPPERWVTANFKETQMGHIHPGERVALTVDAYPGRVFHGHVDSIQQGTGAQFSLLPAENATGNYIKVVQRVPVKIIIDDRLPPEKPLALGMSVVPTVEVK